VCLLYLFFLYGVWCFSVGIIVFVCRGSCVLQVSTCCCSLVVFSLESVAFLPEVLFFEWILVCFRCNYFSCMESCVFPSELLFLFEGVLCFCNYCFFCSLVVVRWNLLLFYRKCCCLEGVWCVFVVIIFIVWGLVFFYWNYCFFFCRESCVFAIIDFFW